MAIKRKSLLLLFAAALGGCRSRQLFCTETSVYQAVLPPANRTFVRLELADVTEDGYEMIGRSKALIRLGASSEAIENFRTVVSQTAGVVTLSRKNDGVEIVSNSVLTGMNMLKLRADPLWTFSRVGFDPPCTNAVVFVDNDCGGLCGFSEFVALKRGAGGWVVVDTIKTPK